MQEVDPKLLDILVCPLTKEALRYDAAKQEPTGLFNLPVASARTAGLALRARLRSGSAAGITRFVAGELD